MNSKNVSVFILVAIAVLNTVHSINGLGVEFESEGVFEANPVKSKTIFKPLLDETDANYWIKDAQRYLKQVLNDPRETMKPKKAKNIIFFLGDGMSLTTVAATRMYLGDENKSLSFEKFAHFGLSKTYCVDKQVADSACSSTAYLSGVKANYGTMGLSAKIRLNDCKGQNDRSAWTDSIAKWAQDQCMDTGLVTTSKVTDASPGGLYSHIANRYWQNDEEVRKNGCDPLETIDMARQLVDNEVSRKFKIVLACGRKEFRDVSAMDEERKPGARHDKRDLIQDWINSRSEQGKSAFVHDKRGLDTLANDTEYVLGLFNDGHCPYNYEVVGKILSKPTLSEMTEKAVKHLMKQNNPNGYFLFVESARIDMGHHNNQARIALDETKEFSKTVEMVRNMTSEEDTLILVTADHAHTMTYSGYSTRGSDILGLNSEKGADGLPYTTLSYANGVGYYYTYEQNGSRIDLSKYDYTNPTQRYPATAPLKSETHGGEDVGIYVSGPESHMFVGTYEQSYIPMLIAHVSEIGPFASKSRMCPKSSSSAQRVPSIPLVFVLLSPILLSLARR